MFNISEFFYYIPVIIVAVGALISIVIEMYSSKSEKILPVFSILMFLAAGAHSLYYIDYKMNVFSNMAAVGGVINVFWALFTFGAAVVTLLSIDYLKKYGIYFGEYYILIQISVIGMMLMGSAKSLFMIFLGLEVMSISFYVLAAMNRRILKANEAGLKYFLLGSFSTGFIVYGIALIYGSVQSTQLDVIVSRFPELTGNLIFIAGLLLFLIGFSFKIAAFPFHMWVPDVYQGSPTTVTALFSTIGKAAAFSAILVTFASVFNSTNSNLFMPYLAVISVLSMFFGSIVAISQNDIKRMLAYSSISHAGYMLIGLAAGNSEGYSGIVFYLVAYTFMNLGAFGIVSLIEEKDETHLSLNSYSGLSAKHPLLAALLAIFMFSLAGLPPFSGFFGKYYIFIAAVKSDLTWLAILGVISSIISVYFYIRLIVLMYFRESEEDFLVEKNNTGLISIIISAVLTIILGIIPGTIINTIASNL